MELCTAPVISRLPCHRLFTVDLKSGVLKFALPNLISLSGYGRPAKLALKSSMSDEYTKDESDGVITIEGTRPAVEAVEEFVEDMQNKQPVDNSSKVDELFELLSEKLAQFSGTEDSFSVFLLGFSALLALYFTNAVLVALDSVPVLPKVMEAVGLLYTIWFVSRYVILQESREELAAIIEDTKKRVLGE